MPTVVLAHSTDCKSTTLVQSRTTACRVLQCRPSVCSVATTAGSAAATVLSDSDRVLSKSSQNVAVERQFMILQPSRVESSRGLPTTAYWAAAALGGRRRKPSPLFIDVHLSVGVRVVDFHGDLTTSLVWRACVKNDFGLGEYRGQHHAGDGQKW